MTDDKNWHDERRERAPSVMSQESFEAQLHQTVENAQTLAALRASLPKRKFEWNNVYGRKGLFTPFELVGIAVIFAMVLTIYIFTS
jgi:hypothetical protein